MRTIALPAERRAVEPVGDLGRAAGAAPVVDRDEGRHAAVRRGEPRPLARDRAALRATAAEVHRQQRCARGAGAGERRRRERAHGARQRAAVGLRQRVAPAGAGADRRAANLPRQRRAEVAPGLLDPDASAAIAAIASSAMSSARPACSTVAAPDCDRRLHRRATLGRAARAGRAEGARSVPVQDRPSRASRTRVTDSGKTMRIASRTCIACSSLRPVELEAGDRRHGHVDRELDRVVGPGDALGALHLLGHLAESRARSSSGSPEDAEGIGAFHAADYRAAIGPRRSRRIACGDGPAATATDSTA